MEQLKCIGCGATIQTENPKKKLDIRQNQALRKWKIKLFIANAALN